MDDSFMSTTSFDDDNFISMALDSENQDSNLEKNIIKPPSAIDISGLLCGQLNNISKDNQIDKRLNDSGTPRSFISHERKRKNITRRCLSNDLSCDFSLNSDDEQMSFQEFRKSKEFKKPNSITKSNNALKNSNILASIENTISPKCNLRFANSSVIDLTPEFNSNKKTKRDENENISRLPISNAGTNNNQRSGVPLQKCFSENHASIMRAVQKSSFDSTLIGDFSRPYALPLLQNCKHQDLKSISCHVLVDLLKGRYNETIESFAIVDCRYPYEFEGGHIKTAINLYTQEHILDKFIKNKKKDTETSDSTSKRTVLIFHCEFSSERGPGLCRFLRNRDRVTNSQVYPYLHYPEIYLLEGGYKEFYTNYKDHCQPCAYLPMHAKEHETELRKFRSFVKSQSFNSKFTTHKRNLRL